MPVKESLETLVSKENFVKLCEQWRNRLLGLRPVPKTSEGYITAQWIDCNMY